MIHISYYIVPLLSLSSAISFVSAFQQRPTLEQNCQHVTFPHRNRVITYPMIVTHESIHSCLKQTSPNENNDKVTKTSTDSDVTVDSPSFSNPTISPPTSPSTMKPNTNIQPPDPSNMTNEQLMAAIGTSPRRIFLSVAASSAIALGADFGGVTGKLLSALPEDLVESSGLDTYFPRGEYKRFKGNQYGYTFIYPKEWVGDTALELAKAQRRAKTLDYTMKNARRSSNTLPDAAFGPPGKLNERGVSQSDTNVSVVASPLPPSFESLQQTLGSPEVAAETLLRVSLAPEGSGRKATLLEACEETRGSNAAGSGQQSSLVYQFDYLVDRGERGVPLRAISSILVKKGGVSNSGVVNVGSTLVTFTVVAPQKDWDEDALYAQKLRRMADSFKLY